MAETVLITGGSGFIGLELTRSLMALAPLENRQTWTSWY